VIRKKFKCPYCSFSAMHQCILKRHMRSHTGERPYPCEICGKKFTRREHMKRHTLVRAGGCVQCKGHSRRTGGVGRDLWTSFKEGSPQQVAQNALLATLFVIHARVPLALLATRAHC